MREVDYERLADFVSGAGEGTEDHEEIARLVASDENWRQALAELTSALAAVDRDLRVLSAESPPMPPEVLSRLESVVSGRGPAPGRARLLGRIAVWLGSRPRWDARAAVAATTVVVVLVGMGVLMAVESGDSEFPATSPANGVAGTEVAPMGASSAGLSAGEPRLLFSGRDYTEQTVGSVSSVESATLFDGGGEAPEPSYDTDAEPDLAELDRLTEETALDSCLTAVVASHGGEVSIVDYARFDGDPALVLVVNDAPEASGSQLVVVVGPACGLGDNNPDERHITVVR